MPYLIEIRLYAHLPSQNHRIKVQFVDALLDKNRPLDNVGSHIHPYPLPGILSHGKGCLSQIISAVGDKSELELFPVLFKPAVLPSLPACI